MQKVGYNMQQLRAKRAYIFQGDISVEFSDGSNALFSATFLDHHRAANPNRILREEEPDPDLETDSKRFSVLRRTDKGI
jgi:hypothetical protein